MTNIIFFFNYTATTEIYTLSLHDSLPIWAARSSATPEISAPTTIHPARASQMASAPSPQPTSSARPRSEEHTSELQSQSNIVCRLLLEKKKRNYISCISNS